MKLHAKEIAKKRQALKVAPEISRSSKWQTQTLSEKKDRTIKIYEKAVRVKAKKYIPADKKIIRKKIGNRFYYRQQKTGQFKTKAQWEKQHEKGYVKLNNATKQIPQNILTPPQGKNLQRDVTIVKASVKVKTKKQKRYTSVIIEDVPVRMTKKEKISPSEIEGEIKRALSNKLQISQADSGASLSVLVEDLIFSGYFLQDIRQEKKDHENKKQKKGKSKKRGRQ